MTQADIVWSTTRPMPRRLRMWTVFLALCFAIAGTLMTRMLMVQPDWLVAAGVGVALGGLLLLFSPRSAFAEIASDGTLTYGFDQRPNLRFDLRAATHLDMVETGMLRGVAVGAPVEAVTILHRKGLSFRSLERQRQAFGGGFVLEFLDCEDLEALRTHRAKLG